MAGQIPGGADDAPDLAIAELSEETTPPLCSLRRWLWVWDRRQWPPQPFGHNFSPLLCALFAILFATNRVRVLCVVCAVRQFACSWLPLRFAPLAAGCFLCHRTLDGRAWSGRLWPRWWRFCALTVDNFRWLEGAEGHRRVWSAWCALLPSLFCAPLCVRLCPMCGAKPCWRGPPGGVLSPSRLLCHQCGTRSIATPSSPSTVVAMGHQPL